MTKRFLILLCGLFVFSPAVYAMTGAQLAAKCEVSMSEQRSAEVQRMLAVALDSGACAGFVGGVVQGVNLVGGMLMMQGAAKKNFICASEQVHARQLVEVTLKFIKANPDMAKLPAHINVYEALSREYPCKE